MAIDWTPDRVKTLMALWTEGVSTLEMGRRLGVTKNAVVGKVHRLGLPKRQSPISKSPRTRSVRPSAETVRLARSTPTPPPLHKGKIISMEMLRPGMCNWPEGEPESENFRFCGEQIVEGKPYCTHHCERAYVSGSRDRHVKPAKVA